MKFRNFSTGEILNFQRYLSLVVKMNKKYTFSPLEGAFFFENQKFPCKNVFKFHKLYYGLSFKSLAQVY